MIFWPLWYQAAATEARAIPRAVSPKAMVGWFLADPKEWMIQMGTPPILGNRTFGFMMKYMKLIKSKKWGASKLQT